MQNAQVICNGMTLQDFQRNDERVRHHVVVHPRVEQLDCSVVGRRREQRQRCVERERSDGFRVISDSRTTIRMLIA